MKTRAAVLFEGNTHWEVVEADLDEPRNGEVLVRMVAAGLCHSDEHLRVGDFVPRYPMVGGHEGAGIVEAVGPGVTSLAVGDHIVCSFIPSCGRCRYCATGRPNICDVGAMLLEGCLPDGTFRLHHDGLDVGGMCMLGTFSQWTVLSERSCVKIPDHVPLDKASLTSCAVPTGWGAAVHAGEVRPGDTVVVYGSGGVGINAVQGARHAGARHVVVVDPVPFKREMAMKLGATHEAAEAGEALDLVMELTTGQGADVSIIAVGVVGEEVARAAFDVLGKGGREIIVGVSPPEAVNIQVPTFFLVNYEKRVQGSIFGSASPQYDPVKLLELYGEGQLHLDELITTTYTLDQINDGYDDLNRGRNIRGVILHEH
ncbi:MAG: NDMA-dependent alcohol dehydrogenase [Acidimicrobiia bacterium]